MTIICTEKEQKEIMEVLTDPQTACIFACCHCDLETPSCKSCIESNIKFITDKEAYVCL